MSGTTLFTLGIGGVISLLDARAGSPPSAGELLLRHAGYMAGLETLLRDWERWAAELMEGHLSYPVLLYFRSQHEHQSWLGSLTAILDASALVIVGVEGGPVRQAQLTFAMARHAIVDLAQASGIGPRPRGCRGTIWAITRGCESTRAARRYWPGLVSQSTEVTMTR